MKSIGIVVFALTLIGYQALAEDHLTPLDARGTSLFVGYDEFVEQAYPAQADELAGFYVGPANMPASYLGILEANSPFRHAVFYAEKTEPEPKVSIVEIPSDFAEAISFKLAEIIRIDTRYGDRKDERFDCLDGIERIFTGQKYYGRADCYNSGSVPDKLTKIYDELAKVGSGSAGSQNVDVALARVVKMLDDILASIKQ